MSLKRRMVAPSVQDRRTAHAPSRPRLDPWNGDAAGQRGFSHSGARRLRAAATQRLGAAATWRLGAGATPPGALVQVGQAAESGQGRRGRQQGAQTHARLLDLGSGKLSVEGTEVEGENLESGTL